MLRFTKMHIADSVTNRIRNIANQVRSEGAIRPSIPPLPAAAEQGAMIDQAVMTPPVAAPAPPGSEPGILAAALEGSPPADAVIGAAIAEEI